MHTQPNTFNVRLSDSKRHRITQKRFRSIRTNQDLLSLRKNSHGTGWPSYDCLDKVARRNIPQILSTSAVRDEQPSDSDDEAEDEACVLIWKRPCPAVDDDDLDDTPPPTTKKGRKEAAAKKGTQGYTKRRAKLDYPYLRNEFGLPSKMPRLCPQDEALEITPLAEKTDGRREFHVYQRLSPFSDVDSPPRSPIAADQIDPETVHYGPDPAAGVDDLWRVIPNEGVDELERNRKRCTHVRDGNRCRAWWTHPSEECWFVHSERSTRPEDPKPKEVDLRRIDPPKEEIITEELRNNLWRPAV